MHGDPNRVATPAPGRDDAPVLPLRPHTGGPVDWWAPGCVSSLSSATGDRGIVPGPRHPGEETFLPTRLAADPRGLSHSTPSSSAGAGSPLIYGAGTAFYPLHAGAPDSGRHGLRHGNDFSNESYLYDDQHAI